MGFCVLKETKKTKNKTKKIISKIQRRKKPYSGGTSPNLGVCTRLMKMLM
jgi:hypothetical protein